MMAVIGTDSHKGTLAGCGIDVSSAAVEHRSIHNTSAGHAELAAWARSALGNWQPRSPKTAFCAASSVREPGTTAAAADRRGSIKSGIGAGGLLALSRATEQRAASK